MMAERKPFELKGIILAYNLFQTLFSAWGFYQVSRKPLSFHNH